MKVYDSRGNSFLLGSEIGKGGEGSVYGISKMDGFAAKIYHRPIDDIKNKKLKSMINVKSEILLRICTWPVDTLHSIEDSPVIGILMPRISGYKEIHKLYSPKTRIIEFPYAGWDFLIHTAANLARAFSVIHEHGHVIGDVNQGNIVVSNKATVMLIDCDSYQVTVEGCQYPCSVGVSIYQPPELQGIKSFDGVIRTFDHDNFSLAIFIFQLLFMGRHPFSGIYTGPGEMPLEKAIKEHCFVYSKSFNYRFMKQPAGTLALESLPKPLVSLFEGAFLMDKRPTSKEWIYALEDLSKKLQQCRVNLAHSYPNKLAYCPWCKIEDGTGAILFSTAAGLYSSKFHLDIAELWRNIDEVLIPEPILALQSRSLFHITSYGDYKKYSRTRRVYTASAITSAIWVMLAFLGTVLHLPWVIIASLISIVPVMWALKPAPIGILARSRKEYDEAKKNLSKYLEFWRQEDGEEQFLKKKLCSLELYNIFKGLEATRQKKLKDLNQNSRCLNHRLINKIDKEFISGRYEVEKALLSNIDELKQLSEEIRIKRKSLLLEIEKATKELIQAEENLKTIGCDSYIKDKTK